MISKTDARGWVTNYLYDPLNRLTNKSYAGDGGVTRAVDLTYDTAIGGVGKLASWFNWDASGSFSWDSMGRTVSEVKNI